MAPLIPGELMPEPGELELNAGRPVTTLEVANNAYNPARDMVKADDVSAVDVAPTVRSPVTTGSWSLVRNRSGA